MPLYEYKCTQCGIIHEKYRSLTDKDLPLECASCGGATRPLTYPTSISVSTPGSDNAPIDIKIGASAEERHKELAERKAARDKVRVESGQNGISATTSGDIRPISTEKKAIRKQVTTMLETGGQKYI